MHKAIELCEDALRECELACASGDCSPFGEAKEFLCRLGCGLAYQACIRAAVI
jgi:hypothetical protein